MTGLDRREDVILQIQRSTCPLSGTKLAALYHVSRQVIVQDIALLRAAGYDLHKQGIYTEYSKGGKQGF